MTLAHAVVFGYLALVLTLGVVAGRRGAGGVADFVAGDRAFGPVLMYFVMGATIFSAYALLGTPQRVVAKGSDAFYILAYGAVGFVPVYFFGARVRRLGAKLEAVTQAELIGRRFDSRFVWGLMGAATVLAFVPYLVIQLKGAGMVMAAVTGWDPTVGAGVVYGVVTVYVVLGGVRGVGWTNVVQGIAMLIVVWGLGLWIPHALYGGVPEMFDRVVAERPDTLVLPGPGPTTDGQYTAEILVSILGFSMWPQVFMKCFTARSSRLVQLSAVLYPTFLFFLVPLLFIGYAAVLEGGPADDTVLLWMLDRPALGGVGPAAFAFVAFAILAASMSTGDALLHAGGSIFVRDVLVGGFGCALDERTQTMTMRACIVILGVVAVLVLQVAGGTSVVDLLLLAYAIPIQFMPLVLTGLYWRRANTVAAAAGLSVGVTAVIGLFVLQKLSAQTYATLNPWDLQIGVIAGALNLATLGAVGMLSAPMDDAHLSEYELG
ncbi:MAG: sodium:solute symporter [Nannocystaceae bacterium]|nr:sodium:solute symporter family protein [bacterium]